MSVYLKGTLVPQRQRLRERWSPSGGFNQDLEWKTFSESQIRSLAALCAANGYEYELVNQHGVWTLIALSSGNGAGGTPEVTIDTWEIGAPRKSIDVKLHPLTQDIINNSGDASAVIRGMKQALDDPTLAYADIDDLDPVDSGDEAIFFALLDTMRAGATSYYQTGYVLKHTTNVSNRYAANIADIGVDRFYTTAQLLSEVQDVSAWVYPLPGRLAYKILDFTSEMASRYGSAHNHSWGWLKFGSSENTVANNRVNIVTEYEFGLISDLLYVAV